nr:hypothetical protein [Azospirillum argentinense]
MTTTIGAAASVRRTKKANNVMVAALGVLLHIFGIGKSDGPTIV